MHLTLTLIFRCFRSSLEIIIRSRVCSFILENIQPRCLFESMGFGACLLLLIIQLGNIFFLARTNNPKI
jgi:hypothetical protein